MNDESFSKSLSSSSLNKSILKALSIQDLPLSSLKMRNSSLFIFLVDSLHHLVEICDNFDQVITGLFLCLHFVSTLFQVFKSFDMGLMRENAERCLVLQEVICSQFFYMICIQIWGTFPERRLIDEYNNFPVLFHPSYGQDCIIINHRTGMTQVFDLVTDFRQISPISSMRVMVSSALLYTFTAHYVFLAIAFFFPKDVKEEAVHDMGRRLVLYGIAALLSVNFLQYGIYHAICAWVLLIIVIIKNGMILMRGVDSKTKGIVTLLYYILIFIWYFGILLFYLINALSNNNQ